MAEIHVYFPQSGSPIVMGDPVPVLKNEHIFWCIHNSNESVKKVEISFDQGAKFFPTSAGDKSTMSKEMSARQCIWGKSPHPLGSGQKRDKYTVKGLDALGQGVGAELDPVIISDDP
ncbi:MAG: hypothetical protein ACREAA_19055 [Candidatus Polarisedimenticolia bacterium]